MAMFLTSMCDRIVTQGSCGDRIVTQGSCGDLSDSALSSTDEDWEIWEKIAWTDPAPLKTKKLVGIPKYITDDFEICLQLESDAGEF